MDFFSSLLGTLAMFFGFGEPATPTAPPVTTQTETVQTEPVSTTTSSGEDVRTEGEDAHATTSEPSQRPAVATATAASSTMSNNEVQHVTNHTMELNDTDRTPVDTAAQDIQTMLVAGGCFWCVEADLEKLPGVIEVVSGYAGGTTENPTYADYGAGGHREVVEVTYDATQITFEDILIVVMKTTDPTDDDGTFADRGDKYSAAFYYETSAQREAITNLIAEVNEHGPYTKPLAIDVEQRPTFWRAEDRHQDYYKGTLTKLKYSYYRNASGRNDFIAEHWGENTGPRLPWRESAEKSQSYQWSTYVKPSSEQLQKRLGTLAYKVTQEEGTEPAGSSPLDKNYTDGIYVDVLSGEPLFSSRDKYDSGTGWPSFVRPITPEAVTEHEDRQLFSTRTEIRSAIADNHLGHVFNDGPADRTGLRYCMNGVALEFVPKSEMEARGYGDFLSEL